LVTNLSKTDKNNIMYNIIMTDCSICLEPIREDIAPLDGCTHRFHPECIIPYFRTPASNGRCPECRRNPFQTDEPERGLLSDQDDFEENDFDWGALRRIRELQRKTAIASNNPTIKRKMQNMNSRIEAAREAHRQAVEIRRKFKVSPEFSKMKADLARHKKDIKEHKSLVNKLSKEIKKRSKVKPLVAQTKMKVDTSKSSIGSQINPLWRYKREPDNDWSEQLSSNAIRRLRKQGIITDETHIWHPEMERSVPFEKIAWNFRHKFI
jgi:hypothetical protein